MAYRNKNTPVQITVPHYREPLSGAVNTAMIAGALVQYDAAAPIDTRVLIPANGGLPAILEGTVLTDAAWQEYNKLNPDFNMEIRKKVPVGSSVSARFAHEAEFEGAAYFTGITAATPANTPLKTAAGKFAIGVVGTDKIIGYLGRLVTPFDAAAFRWTVEFIG
jgi:hypothetical protein